MNVLPDTHALAWWLAKDELLGKSALPLLEDNSTSLVLPVLVMVELHYMNANRNMFASVEAELVELREIRDVVVVDLTEDVARHVDLRLDVHDAIIVATALHFRALTGEPITVITRDRKIRDSGLVEVVW